MSATNQFPPRHLLPEEDVSFPAPATSSNNATGTDNSGENKQPGAEKPETETETETGEKPPLALPATNAPQGETKKLDVSGKGEGEGGEGEGKTTKVALDELGPMVVNKDGTLSRIHNWASMTDGERERTLRVLGKRNQLRMGELRGEEV